MSTLVPPYGADSLKPLLLPEVERAEEARRAQHLKTVPLSSREVSDLLMLGMGAYTPLDGFMGEADWRGCCAHMKLAGGLFWPIPITLSCAQDLADEIGIGEDVALTDGESGELLGILAERLEVLVLGGGQVSGFVGCGVADSRHCVGNLGTLLDELVEEVHVFLRSCRWVGIWVSHGCRHDRRRMVRRSTFKY